MSWARNYIEKLQIGEAVSFRPRGNSMEPKIKSGWLVTVEPTPHDEIRVGDIVLCTVGRADYLHLVKAIHVIDDSLVFVIGNNKGHINGRTTNVYGKVTKVE